MGNQKIRIENPQGQSLQLLADIPQRDPNPILIITITGEVVFANKPGQSILEYWLQLYDDLPDAILKQAHIAQVMDQPTQFELKVTHKIYLFSLVWIPESQHINLYGTDISQLKTPEQDKLNMTRFDDLTEISNRQNFEDILLEQIHTHKMTDKKLALLLVDFDDFQLVNESLGRLIGNKLLKAASKRMAHCIRLTDFIAHLGEDEFIIIVTNTNADLATKMAEKIMQVLSRIYQFGNQKIKVTASIGISLYPESGLTASDLLRHADIAMHQAKNSGKNNCSIFSAHTRHTQNKRYEVIKNELKFAASKNELYVEYQPQLNIHTQKIIGFEALLRWRHPQQGLISPDEFFPVAEQTGCMQTISQWLIECSIKDCAPIFAALPNSKLSINLSLSELKDPRFFDSLCDNLRENNLDKNHIILDIAECHIAPHFNQIAIGLKKIHALGLKICLDNFNNPQVGLTKLLALYIDYLKLDQQLLLRIGKSENHRTLLKGIIHIANELKIVVIQKGIETEEQHNIVKSLGCQYAQGHYYCPPVKINELLDVIKKYQ